MIQNDPKSYPKSRGLYLHPWKLTCPPKRDYFSREYIFQSLIFRGHVSFQGSMLLSVPSLILRKRLQHVLGSRFIRLDWWSLSGVLNNCPGSNIGWMSCYGSKTGDPNHRNGDHVSDEGASFCSALPSKTKNRNIRIDLHKFTTRNASWLYWISGLSCWNHSALMLLGPRESTRLLVWTPCAIGFFNFQTLDRLNGYAEWGWIRRGYTPQNWHGYQNSWFGKYIWGSFHFNIIIRLFLVFFCVPHLQKDM